MVKFTDICRIICVRRCFNGGHSVAEIAKVAKQSAWRTRKDLLDSGLTTTRRRRNANIRAAKTT